MLVLSYKLGGVRGLFCKIVNARGLSPALAVSAWAGVRMGRICRPPSSAGPRGPRVWSTREIHFFSKELEMVS